MANSMTEHSKQLRAKTAEEWTKQKLASGELRRVVLKGKAEILDQFDAVVEKLGVSRPQALKILCEHYLKTAV